MKKSILFLIAILISVFTFAQQEKYVSMMEASIAQMDAAKTVEDIQKIVAPREKSEG